MQDAREIHNMLWGIGNHCTHVPVPTPVSLMREHLALLHDKTYVVSEKNDGVRKQLLLASTEHGGVPYGIFVDRAWGLEVHKVQVRKSSVFFKNGDPFDGTLFDGEWMSGGDGWPTFVVFDVVAVCGFDMKKKPFNTRLAIARDTINGLNIRGVRFTVKAWHPVSEAGEVWAKQKQADGLVFMPLADPVGTGRHNTMFKYKSPEKHTLDFLYTADGQFVYGEGAGEEKNVSEVGVQVKNPHGVELCAGTVYECQPRGGAKTFDVLEPRSDKTAPNHGRTVTLTLDTIREHLTPKELLLRIKNE